MKTSYTKMNASLGFTLAEVLITLGIIGVVAAMTIPTLTASYQKTQALTAYKKVLSAFSQAMRLAEAENGDMDSWDWPGTGLALTQSFADTYLYPNIKTIQKCSNAVTDCWKNPVSLDNTAGYLDSSVAGNALTAIFADGSSIYFWAGTSPWPKHVQLWLDIDGPKKGKGMLGKDVFGFILQLQATATTKQGVYPVGLDEIPALTRTTAKTDPTFGCSKTTASGVYAGRYCSAMMTLDGWKFADDYPW